MNFFYIILLFFNQINTEIETENTLQDFAHSLYEQFKEKEKKTLKKIYETYKQKLINLQTEHEQQLSQIKLELNNIKAQDKTIQTQKIIEQLKTLEIKLDLIALKLKKNRKLVEKIYKIKHEKHKNLFKKYENLILKSEKEPIQ